LKIFDSQFQKLDKINTQYTGKHLSLPDLLNERANLRLSRLSVLLVFSLPVVGTSAVRDRHHVSIRNQSLNDRFTEKSVDFVKLVLKELLEYKWNL